MKLCDKHKEQAQYIRFEEEVDRCLNCQKLQNAGIEQLEAELNSKLETGSLLYIENKKYEKRIKQLKDRAKKVVDLIGGPMDQKNLDILWGAIDELKKVLEKYKL